MEKKTYNIKKFLLPDSPRSMASFHAKVMEDGIMKLTMHDCKGSIQLHNNLNNPDEIKESIEKLRNLAEGILQLTHFIETAYVANHTLLETQLHNRQERVLQTKRWRKIVGNPMFVRKYSNQTGIFISVQNTIDNVDLLS